MVPIDTPDLRSARRSGGCQSVIYEFARPPAKDTARMRTDCQRSRRPTVLIVGHDLQLRNFIRLTLDNRRFRLLEADDGVTATRLARRERPQLVLVAIDPEDHGGLEVCRILKSDSATSSLKIVILHDSPGTDGEQAAARAGADGYLSVSLSPRELLGQLADIAQQ